MARLPQPGQDNGTWGSILNDFLSQSHSDDGTLKADSVGSTQLQDDAVTAAAIAPGSVTKTDVGLGNVDNTSDASKPISTATQTALDTKLTASNNLSDLANATTARSNLGLANVATTSTSSFTGATTIVEAPASPAPQDQLPLELLTDAQKMLISGETRALARTPGNDLQIDRNLHLGTRRNIWQYTEDVASNRYTFTGTKQTDTISADGITLTRLSFSNFYHAARSQITGLGLTPYTAGQRYLLSFYGAARTDVEQFLSVARGAPANTSDYGHGLRHFTNRVRRVWGVVHATSTALVDYGSNPTVALGSGSGSDTYWVAQSSAEGNAAELYVGGFQIELLPDPNYVDGIAWIGDSTIAGSAGLKDLPTSREVTRYVESLLNVSCFNRGVGGNKLSDMDARWTTDITPLKPRSKYVIIQGGGNDFGNDFSLASAQSAVNSMIAKATSDGFIPILLTCTPSTSMASVSARETNRLAYNQWLKQTFPRVIDIASVVEDPYDPKFLRRDASWYGDGTHYGRDAKRAIAAYIASWPHWDFYQPSPYQPITASTYTNPAALYRDGVQVVGARDTGWTAGTGTQLKGAFDANTATATQAAQRVLAIENALRAHGLIN